MVSLYSCETQDSLDPRPVIVGGQYVRLDITKKLLAFEHLDEAQFGGTLTTPGGNVEKYVLKVRRKNPNGITTGNYVELLTVNTFPYELIITPQMIAAALGIPVTELQFADFYLFLGESYGFDGKVVNYNNLSPTVKTQPGMKQGYKFMTSLQLDQTIIDQPNYNNYQLIP